MTESQLQKKELFYRGGQAGGRGNFPKSESGLLPQAKDLEPKGSSLPLPPKRALVYEISFRLCLPQNP
jgi:hypothetical protein